MNIFRKTQTRPYSAFQTPHSRNSIFRKGQTRPRKKNPSPALPPGLEQMDFVVAAYFILAAIFNASYRFTMPPERLSSLKATSLVSEPGCTTFVL